MTIITITTITKMARITDDVLNNSYPDTVTLTGNCTYVYIGDGCTGTVKDCNYVETGENNTNLELDSSTYVVIGDNNTDIAVIDSDYIIVGSNNSNVHIGEQRDTTQFPTSSGANSIVVATECRGIDITGTYAEMDRTNYVAVDGCFNKFKDSSTITAVCTGNTFDNARFVDVAATNNNYIYADNLTLKTREAFFSYNKVKDVLKVQPIYKPIEQQSDSFGTILDRPNSKITNDTPKAGDYVLDNGRWVLRT